MSDKISKFPEFTVNGPIQTKYSIFNTKRRSSANEKSNWVYISKPKYRKGSKKLKRNVPFSKRCRVRLFNEIKTFHKQAKRPCQLCGCTCERNLRAKKFVLKQNKIYACSKCSYRTFFEQFLKLHKVICHKTKCLHCHICGFKTFNQSDFTVHLRAHLDKDLKGDNDVKDVEVCEDWNNALIKVEQFDREEISKERHKKFKDVSNITSSLIENERTYSVKDNGCHEKFVKSFCRIEEKQPNDIQNLDEGNNVYRLDEDSIKKKRNERTYSVKDNGCHEKFVKSFCRIEEKQPNDIQNLDEGNNVYRLDEDPIKKKRRRPRKSQQNLIDVSKSERKREYVCDLCGHAGLQRKEFMRHIKKHSSNREFFCKLCPYMSDSLSKLKQHIVIHGEKRYLCHECGFKTYSSAVMKYHMNGHAGITPFQCDLCKVRCKRLNDLTRHKRVHLPDRPYACTICDYRAKHRKNLKAHMYSHKTETPFACELCGKTFKRMQYLNIHKKKHVSR